MLCCVTRTESRQADPLVCKQQQHQKRLHWLSPKGSLNMAKSCYGRSPRAQHTLYCCTGLQLRHDCLAMTLEGFCKPAVLLTKAHLRRLQHDCHAVAGTGSPSCRAAHTRCWSKTLCLACRLQRRPSKANGMLLEKKTRDVRAACRGTSTMISSE